MRGVWIRLALGSTVLGSAVLLAGCDRWVRPEDRTSAARLPASTPKPEQLVAYMNSNAQRIRSLESFDLDIDAKADNQSVGLSGTMACQKNAPGQPANFRMQARVLGKTEVDIGSNSQEFWYWIARAPQPYVFHCSYPDFRAGKAKMPFPFQPEWIVEALGMAEYDPGQKYEVRETKQTIELIENTTSPQGEAVQKVTVFSRSQSQGRAPQVAARILRDPSGKEICAATVSEIQVDQLSGAIVPRVVKMRWPAEKMELTMKLNKLQVNGRIDDAQAAARFSRQSLGTLPGYDLARGPDAPANAIRPAGGIGGR